MIEKLIRRSLRKGLVDGNRVWLTVGLLGLSAKIMKQLGGEGDKVLFRERLRPGESLTITERPSAKLEK